MDRTTCTSKYLANLDFLFLVLDLSGFLSEGRAPVNRASWSKCCLDNNSSRRSCT